SIADRIAVMHDGVLEQVATPTELYARPATRFVATFIGTMNLLDGRVDGRDRAVAGPFTLPLPPDHGLSDGARIVAGVRPEEFTLSSGAGDAGGGMTVCARVTQITDLGHYYRVVVEAPETERITVFVTKQHDLTIGPCTITPKRVLWYVDDRLVGMTEQSTMPGYVGAAQ
ncbi:MAG: TOBE domain-containing protein, partial [Chloroflexota bacterium]|nr:TOBE domain-containing protein [Chloroflexota bacterium]